MHVQGLRSCYEMVGGLVYFARMADKVRLHSAGRLPADYVPNLGKGFDDRCATFLRVPYENIARKVMEGGRDEETIAWCFETGGGRSDEEKLVWNDFMRKRGWRDEATARLKERLRDYELEARQIETFFDLIDADEGRPLRTGF